MSDIIKKCRVSGKDFVIKERDQAFYKMMDVPLPTVGPRERLRRRLVDRDTRVLYYRKCDLTGKKIISPYHEDSPFPVYGLDAWWGDVWDPADYARDYDFNRPFFEQFLELRNVVPHMSAFVAGGYLENSEFTNCVGYLKNCYMIFEGDYNEDCYYSNRVYHCNNVCDCTNAYDCELCYQGIDVRNCQRTCFLQECEECHDCYFLKKCIGCSDCLGCINQRHKQYMILNKQYSKEDYEAKKKELRLDTTSGLEEFAKVCGEFFVTQPHVALEMERCENCTGDHLYDSKNSLECFDAKDLEDCKWCHKVAGGVKDCMDYTAWGFKAERVYESSSCGDNAYNLRFCSTCTTNLSDLDYCMGCTGCRNCFGCVGMKKKEYCILNKQYSECDYFEMRDRIIEHMKSTGEWGEYFPIFVCNYAYNETHVMDFMPLAKEEAMELGYHWRDEDKREYKKSDMEVPDAADDIDDGICDKIFSCEVMGKNYRIIAEELKFYKKTKLPVPRRCPDQRHADRMAKRNPWELYRRKCAKTGADILTSFAPDRPEKVYSREAYLEEVY